MITIKQTSYFSDNFQLYKSESKVKKLIQVIRKNTTVDLGGVMFGAISLVALIVGL